MGAANALQVISVSPAFVSRAKCPPGYSFVGFGPRGALGSVAHLGHPAGTCVLTKVARALGLVRRRRGRGISARDLRAALRVTRLVKHIAQQLEVDPDLLRAHPSSCCCPNCEERLILDDF